MAVTRDDVAKRAGVSPAVVSYVLNDGPRPASASARRRVLAAVEELGYRPDRLARSLRLGKTHTLALVVPDASNPFFAELACSIEAAAFARGYAVFVCNTADDLVRERFYIENLMERRVDGLMLVSARDDRSSHDFRELSIPVVAIDRPPDASNVVTIAADNVRGAQLGTQHLVDHGHTEIGFVSGPGGTSVSDTRRAGWARTLQTADLTTGAEVSAPFSFEGGRRAALEMFASVPAPTAVFVSSDVQAIGLIRGLHDLGRAVPRDVAVVSVDGTRAGAYARPSLTSVAQPIAQMGEKAVARLIDSDAGIVHQALDNELLVRESCGCSASSP